MLENWLNGIEEYCLHHHLHLSNNEYIELVRCFQNAWLCRSAFEYTTQQAGDNLIFVRGGGGGVDGSACLAHNTISKFKSFAPIR